MVVDLPNQISSPSQRHQSLAHLHDGRGPGYERRNAVRSISTTRAHLRKDFIMRHIAFPLATCLGLFATLPASAQKASSAPTAKAHTLCAANEEHVFACTLQGKRRKMVALCAAPMQGSAQEDKAWSFRYLFGRPGQIELSYPAPGSGPSADAFTFTRLIYAGDTGGYAHTFTNEGYRYILYSVSGRDVERAGLLVQRDGKMRAMRDMECAQSTFTETRNEALSRLTSSWKAAPDIDAHGLPSTR
jgi:hypothetical protein